MIEKLKELGYIVSTCENIMVGRKDLFDLYLHIILIDGTITDYGVMENSIIKDQSQIDNIQTVYNVLQSDLKELGE